MGTMQATKVGVSYIDIHILVCQCITMCLAFLWKIILSVTALEPVCVLFVWKTDNLFRATLTDCKVCFHTNYFTYYEWQCMAVCAFISICERTMSKLRKTQRYES